MSFGRILALLLGLHVTPEMLDAIDAAIREQAAEVLAQ
jgi:hypothetical protein